ncbi:MAG: hypothetical protein K6343_06020 [Caldisericaceae bacterium]
METQEITSNQIEAKGIIKKSPQELAAQIVSAYGTSLDFKALPKGEQLYDKYKEIRSYV